MEFKKLDHQEAQEWGELFSSDYESSPLRCQMEEELFYLISLACTCAIDEQFAYMHEALGDSPELLAQGLGNQAFRALLKRAYEHAIACGDAAACCNLGNMYHDNDAEEDYIAARELYELGRSRGDSQSSVNLGYIYYYGRSVERDYQKAYECFAFGALVGGNPEGYWKLGDLYTSGKGTCKNHLAAWTLYCKAHELSGDSPVAARAAHHMADYLLNGIEGHLERNPYAALKLYNEAECGYYKLIDSGLAYYRRQLEQAIAGQEAARCIIREIR